MFNATLWIFVPMVSWCCIDCVQKMSHHSNGWLKLCCTFFHPFLRRSGAQREVALLFFPDSASSNTFPSTSVTSPHYAPISSNSVKAELMIKATTFWDMFTYAVQTKKHKSICHPVFYKSKSAERFFIGNPPDHVCQCFFEFTSNQSTYLWMSSLMLEMTWK